MKADECELDGCVNEAEWTVSYADTYERETWTARRCDSHVEYGSDPR
jgi:hypothetical protein